MKKLLILALVALLSGCGNEEDKTPRGYNECTGDFWLMVGEEEMEITDISDNETVYYIWDCGLGGCVVQVKYRNYNIEAVGTNVSYMCAEIKEETK